jgi:hypothetical protein
VETLHPEAQGPEGRAKLMADRSLLGAIWQTLLTWRRRRNVACPHCAARALSFRDNEVRELPILQSVTTPRGYVLRCWQCGGEYAENVNGLRLVWPVPDQGGTDPERTS